MERETQFLGQYTIYADRFFPVSLHREDPVISRLTDKSRLREQYILSIELLLGRIDDGFHRRLHQSGVWYQENKQIRLPALDAPAVLELAQRVVEGEAVSEPWGDHLAEVVPVE